FSTKYRIALVPIDSNIIITSLVYFCILKRILRINISKNIIIKSNMGFIPIGGFEIPKASVYIKI
ncbi:hypothetical protein, partial [Clostridium perfringens]|uniref:hypothetical protein n=2 Tax=Clostridium perfringens TaxID=1502 RepID=UPI0039EB0B1F